MDLPTQLTFLSACSGAVGAQLPGEGLDSLASALLESGSESVIASLWDVEDLPTRTLVEQYYYYLGQGDNPGSALRSAKLAMIVSGGEMAAPRHWAGWSLIGRGGIPLQIETGNTRFLFAVLLVIALAAVATIVILRRRTIPQF